jgi:uncharacterized ferritin-like protein (DUF455 family)
MAKMKSTEEVDKAEVKTKGARDEFEAIAVVVAENRGLTLKVLQKIKIQKEMSKSNILDVISDDDISTLSQNKAAKAQ